ncbi:MAG: drug/metabolite exporter YedA [Paludibacterium sp.]|uniref:drug/metabolite exporter YedA n=1 Tax=Paludibacterium sp. TaxID=1917523 RepID=UPI0025FC4048|nr:drug/metabolite exporter YedA [Paludibacterium sp.]MBV8048603.1 drug/metabolite exporter YedA [Paludibacterium sp.]MBV8647623.1 drug/metabolite exporter YedA [Paludibacterium sp.]
MTQHRLPVLFSLFALYIIWGSTYFAIRIGVEHWPPLMMAGVRFLLAGMLMFGWLIARGAPMPNRREWGGAALLGLLMPAIGNGLVTMAETHVSSGVAALVVATVPLFTTLFAGLLGHPARPKEWLALALGFCGIVLLNFGANLGASPIGAVLLILACAGWALGSALSKKVTQPKGMMSSAAMMLCAGVELLLGSTLRGEHLSALPPLSGWLAMLYLAVFGSIVAYTAYIYLLAHVRASLATSYAYVNPVIAVLLGMGLLGEHVGQAEWAGMGVIVSAVLLLAWRR